MSWSAPVAGATPYQQQPYPGYQPGYGQQPPVQYGQQPAHSQYPQAPSYPVQGQPQRAPHIQPPKKKGNPIITRYPPPPGYRGPAQPQVSFGANQYPGQFQQIQSGFGQAPHAPFAYPPQAYNAPPTPAYSPQGYGPPQTPTYPQQPFAQAQTYQWPQQSYQPNQPYPQAPHQPGGQPHATAGYPPQTAPPDPSQHPYPQAAGWPQSNGQAQYPTNQAYPYNGASHYDSNATPTPTSAYPVASHGSQVPSQPASVTEGSFSGDKASLRLDLDDWDFDFEGAIWPKSNEPVDPALSLGVIIWHPAKQVTRALPSTFDLAEEQSLKPSPEKLENGESVSIYFTAENSHEAFLDVRQTSQWDAIRDDPIFVVLTDDEMRKNMVSLEDCIGQRDRPDDPQWDSQHDNDEEMPDASWSVMDHLEQVLSRTNGGASQSTPKQTAASPAGPSQEDILAKLGVTGTPKPPSGEPISIPFPEGEDPSSTVQTPKESAVMPRSSGPQPPQQRSQFHGGPKENGYDRKPQKPYASTSSGHPARFTVPPPPPPPETQRYDPWNQPHNGQSYDGFRGSPARSDNSNHTMAGSDFEPEKPSDGDANDQGMTEMHAVLHRSDSSFSRKRSYEDTDQDDGKPRQHDDHTKRKRRSQVESAYSRR